MVFNGTYYHFNFFLSFVFRLIIQPSNCHCRYCNFVHILWLNNTFSLVVSLSSIPFSKDLKFSGLRAEFNMRISGKVYSGLQLQKCLEFLCQKMDKQQQMKKRLDIRCRKNNYLLACSKFMCS